MPWWLKWSALLLLAVGIGVMIGRQSLPVGTPTPAVKPSAEQVAALEARNSNRLGSAPRRTFRGPDGKMRLIDYGSTDKQPLSGPELRAALIDGIRSDLLHHPNRTIASFELLDHEVKAFLASPDAIPAAVASALPETESK